ncbi:MAG: hypothetical protein NZP34_14020 [Caldilineales bacterium]|nr:hypothetical protein [Caldilineales bacterium]
MDHIAILKHAAQTTLRHRALWVLGFLWALVSGSGGFSGNFGNIGTTGFGEPMTWSPELTPWLLTALVVFLVLFCVLVPIAVVLSYVLWAGIGRVLDAWYTRQIPPTVGAGFREGWHRRTWRLFLLNLVVYVPVTLVFLATLLVAASPLLLLLVEEDVATVIGVVMAIGLLIPTVLVWVVVFAVLAVLAQFWWRAVVLDDQPISTALRYGWELVRGRLRDVAIMWLLMFGVNLLLSMVLFVVFGLAAGLALVVAGGPAWLLSRLTDSLVPALLWGVPVGFVVLMLPTLFVTGLYLVFQTAVWNQVYRLSAGDAARS